MKCIIIDDEPDCVELLDVLIGKHCPELEIIGRFTQPRLAIDAIWDQRPELVFLDVDMPEINGFGVLDACKSLQFQVVFTTAYQDYAVKAFKYSATDFLLKPIDRSELLEAVEKAKHALSLKQLEEQRALLFSYLNPAHPERERIALHTSDGIVFLTVADIDFCKADGNYTDIYLSTADKPQVFVKPLGQIEELLTGPTFFRPHHSYIVNLKKVDKFIKGEGGQLLMKSGQLIPVSRPKKDELVKRLEGK